MGADNLRALEGAVNPEARKVLLALVLSATWLGSSNAIREIVKERPIYRRERAAGVSVTAYVTSKVVVLAGVLFKTGDKPVLREASYLASAR